MGARALWRSGDPMYHYRELIITSSALDDGQIIEFVETFARSTPGWLFAEMEGRQYAADCGSLSCCLIHETTTLPKAAIHLTQRKSKRMARGVYMPNIVPLDRSAMTTAEYNAVALRFARELRLRAREDGVFVRILLTSPTLTLRQLIRSKIARTLFQRYIGLFPKSNHPADLARLDAFICALSRYSRSQFDIESFERLLSTELGWSATMASRCRTRVEIGLGVLAANRNFSSL